VPISLSIDKKSGFAAFSLQSPVLFTHDFLAAKAPY
jgi:hypothetical protein